MNINPNWDGQVGEMIGNLETIEKKPLYKNFITRSKHENERNNSRSSK